MARALSGTMTTEVAKAAIAPVMFVEMFFASGVVRAWSGIGAITWNGSTWVGGGELMAISAVEETKSIESTSVTLTLSGVPSALVAVAYSDFSQGRAVRVYLGMLNTAAGTIVADPIQIFGGRLDTISDQDDGQTATIAVTAESNLADLDRLRVRFFTDEDQQRLFESDRSLRYMSAVQDRPIYWGTADKIGTPKATKL